MPQRTNLRKVHTYTYSSGQIQREEINVSGYIRELILELEGSLTVTGDVTNVLTENPSGLVPQLTVWLNGEEVLHQGRWEDYRYRDYVTTKLGSQTAIAGGTAAASPYPFHSIIRLPFETPNARRGVDTVLALPAADRLEVEVTWGSGVASVVNGGTATFGTTPTIDVLADIVRTAPAPTHVYKTRAQDYVSGAAANTAAEIELNRGPRTNYSHMILLSEDIRTAANGGRQREALGLNDIVLRQESNGEVSNIVGPLTGDQVQREFDQLKSSVDGIQTGIFPLVWQARHRGMGTFNVATAPLNDLRFLIDHDAPTTAGRLRVLQGVVEKLG